MARFFLGLPGVPTRASLVLSWATHCWPPSKSKEKASGAGEVGAAAMGSVPSPTAFSIAACTGSLVGDAPRHAPVNRAMRKKSRVVLGQGEGVTGASPSVIKDGDDILDRRSILNDPRNRL